MNYYKLKDNIVEKYKVSFNSKEVEKFKNKIINDCSEIVHENYTSDYYVCFSKDEIIRNYKETKVGQKEYFEETRTVYEYSYDRYVVPYLVKLLNKLLKGEDVLTEILTYKTLDKLPIDIKIDDLQKELKYIADTNTKEKIEKLKKLEKLLEAKKLNKNQKPLSLYRDELTSLFNFKLVDTLTLEELNKFQKFTGINFLIRNGIMNYGEDSKAQKKKIMY